MPDIAELQRQRDQLDAQINVEKAAQRTEAIAHVRGYMELHGLTAADFTKGSTRVGAKVAPKYRDAATGATWTGRGKAPLWIAGATDRTRFAI